MNQHPAARPPGGSPQFEPAGPDAMPPIADMSSLAATAGGGEQWLSQKLQLRPDLKFEIRHAENQINYVLEDHARNRYFQIGTVEFEFIQLLNGERTVGEALQQVNRAGPRIEPSAAQEVISWLTMANLVRSDCVAATERIIKSHRQKKLRSWMTLVNPVTFKIPLFNPDRMLAQMLPAVGWIFSRTFFLIWLATVAYAGYLFFDQSERVAHSSQGILSGTRWIWLLVWWVVLKVVHELGHGLAAKKYGAHATETGVLMLLFTPLAYIDVSSSWKLRNRWHRIMISSAGMYVEMLIAAVAIIIWARTESGVVADVCFNLYLMAGVTTILFNANPLMRFDGYFILADLLGYHNLYTRAQKLVSTLFKTAVGMPAEQLPKMDRKQWVLLVYGCGSFLWKISISVGLILGAAALFGGFGLVFAITGGVMWVLLPLLKAARAFYRARTQGLLNRRRFAVALGFMVILGLVAFQGLRAPALHSAPAIVRFQDEVLLRIEAPGFLESVCVTDGEQVKQGQLLFRLRNALLEHEARKLELSIEQALIRARLLKYEGQESESQAELEQAHALQAQLRERQAEVDALCVRAPQDGVLFARELEDRIGSYLEVGDEIATLARSDCKEVVVAFAHTELDDVQNNAAQPVRLGFPAAPLLTSHFTKLNPRASDRAADPALTAAYGGRLPVRPVSDANSPDEERVRLISHHFSATVELDPQQSELLQAGQRGTAYIRTTSQSMGVYAYLQAQHWFREKMEMLTQTRGY